MALFVAVTGGSVISFTVVVFGLLGISISFYLDTLGYGNESEIIKLIYGADAIAAFGFGASSIALFARVAGGIYTKAADIGADLVGKVEMDIPEDDPRNPAVIADNGKHNQHQLLRMSLSLTSSHAQFYFLSSFIYQLGTTLEMLPGWELIFSNLMLEESSLQ